MRCSHLVPPQSGQANCEAGSSLESVELSFVDEAMMNCFLGKSHFDMCTLLVCASQLTVHSIQILRRVLPGGFNLRHC